MPWFAYWSSTQCPEQQTEAAGQSKRSTHPFPRRVVVVVEPPLVVVVVTDMVVVVAWRGLPPGWRFTHTPRAHTRFGTPAVMQSTLPVQWTMAGSSVWQVPEILPSAPAAGSQWSPAGQFSVEPAQSPTTHLSP
jgi:hypothetical protein